MNSNYIILYDDLEDIDEKKLELYNTIIKELKGSNISLFLIKPNMVSTDFDIIVDKLKSDNNILNEIANNIVEIYINDMHNIKELIKNSMSIFYFSIYKDDFISKNIDEIISYNKFILHKNIDKYNALIKVLKNMAKNSDHKYNNSLFLTHYNKLKEANKIIKPIKKVNNELIPYLKEIKEEEVETNEVKGEENTKIVKGEDTKIVKGEVKKKIEIKKNIKINMVKDDTYKSKNVYITFYVNTEIQLSNEIQIKCIIENIKNKLFDKILLFNYNKSVDLIPILKNELNNEDISKIMFIENVNEEYNILKIKDVINYVNENYVGDIIYLARSDILIPEQNDIKKIALNFFENNYVYAISRMEHNLNGNIFKDKERNAILYSNMHDLYIFKSVLNIDESVINKDIYENLDFYTNQSELLFNKILENSGYNIINDTINCKILRIISYNNDINKRDILKEDKNNYNKNINNCAYIPENIMLNKITLQKYIDNLDLSNEEDYLIKQYVFRLILNKNLRKNNQ